MAKRIRHANHELVHPQYIERYTRKGWLDRHFNIGGIWYRWKRNIATERGLLRFGVRHDNLEDTMERS